jgi:hypothetical protein
MSSAVPTPKINYQGNSKLDKEIAAESSAPNEGPKLKKIEGVSFVEVKPTLGRRIRSSFGGQNLKLVGAAVLAEVIIPTAKDLLSNVIDEGSRRMIYGESGGRKRSATANIVGSALAGSATRIRSTNYSTISSQPTAMNVAAQSLSARERNNFDFTNLVFPERAQVEGIIEQMYDTIEEYGMITVGGFYDLIGQTGTGFTDQKFAWDARAFAGTKPGKVREGWILDLPLPLEVK